MICSYLISFSIAQYNQWNCASTGQNKTRFYLSWRAYSYHITVSSGQVTTKTHFNMIMIQYFIEKYKISNWHGNRKIKEIANEKYLKTIYYNSSKKIVYCCMKFIL